MSDTPANSPAEPGYLAVRYTVRWGDCDPAGIAYYPRFFEWTDLASHTLARHMGITRDDMLPPKLWGLPLTSAQLEFLAPARMDDVVEARAWVSRLGRSSFGVRLEVWRLADERGPEQLLARGSEGRVHVVRDAEGRMRARELTPQMRAAMERYRDPTAANEQV